MIRRIKENEIYESLKDPYVKELFEYEGIKPGETLEEVQAKVIAIFGHPESSCYWCIVKKGDEYWEVSIN